MRRTDWKTWQTKYSLFAILRTRLICHISFRFQSIPNYNSHLRLWPRLEFLQCRPVKHYNSNTSWWHFQNSLWPCFTANSDVLHTHFPVKWVGTYTHYTQNETNESELMFCHAQLRHVYCVTTVLLFQLTKLFFSHVTKMFTQFL